MCPVTDSQTLHHDPSVQEGAQGGCIRSFGMLREAMESLTLFLDLDGVLANFDLGCEQLLGISPSKVKDHVDWGRINGTPAFYTRLPLMPDARLLWEFCKPYSPTILTGIPKSVSTAEVDKRTWVARYLGPDVPVLCCPSADKFQFSGPGRVLVDDWERYRDRWLGAGGIWVTHTDARSTIVTLKVLGFA